jgi:HSP20 family protein
MMWPMTLFDELEQMRRDMDRWFDAWTGMETQPAYPAVNVWTNDNGAVVTAEVPGLDAQSLDVSVKQNMLTIAGERKPDKADEDGSYHRRERGYGKFSRTVRLPFEVDAASVKARYTNGILRIELPRSEASKPRKIAIESA